MGKLSSSCDIRAEAQKIQENNELICAVGVSAPQKKADLATKQTEGRDNSSAGEQCRGKEPK